VSSQHIVHVEYDESSLQIAIIVFKAFLSTCLDSAVLVKGFLLLVYILKIITYSFQCLKLFDYFLVKVFKFQTPFTKGIYYTPKVISLGLYCGNWSLWLEM